MKKDSHAATILKKLIEGQIMVSCDVLASNSNQYFKQIRDNGVELIEWTDISEGKHSKRKLKNTSENIERAKKYLKKLQG